MSTIRPKRWSLKRKRLLASTRTRLSDAQHWTKGRFAATSKRGHSVYPKHGRATAFCLVGSLMHDNGADVDPVVELIREVVIDLYPNRLKGMDRLADRKPQEVVFKFNDNKSTTHGEVVAVLEEAARRAAIMEFAEEEVKA